MVVLKYLQLKVFSVFVTLKRIYHFSTHSCWIKLSKLQVLSFMFVSDFRRCPLPLKLMSFVLNVLKSYTLCPLAITLLVLLVK
ncbi:hypothetical protein HanRHA438_Chr10g0451591 [Helianthus annuus]|nr:hypothetical protein HanIR_Chr10g0473671 [Helianthus annuus]KAJ0879447.1 hypothetical protein HanRHA438_Chr10g0451591 [Helianthus annuus]